MSFSSVSSELGLNAPYFVFVTVIVLVLSTASLLFSNQPPDHDASLRRTHRKIGTPLSASRLQDQGLPVHKAQPGRDATIKTLFIYPIKSCRGIELSRSKVLPSGLEFDRFFTFAQNRSEQSEEDQDGATWTFITQRQNPLLANVRVDLWQPDASKSSSNSSNGEYQGRGLLVVTFPWSEGGALRGFVQWARTKATRGLGATAEKSFVLSVDFPSAEAIVAKGYKYANVKVWSETVKALNLAREVPLELREYLGVKGRLGLFMMDPSRQRHVFDNAPTKEVIGYQPVVDFQDSYPLHLLCLSSLQALESMIQKDGDIQYLSARRFRPNVIVSGTEEFEEDAWRTIEFANVGNGIAARSRFDVSCRTTRCKLPNVDPSTGVRHRVEPDRSLRKYRAIDEGAPKHGCMGMQLCPLFETPTDPEKNHSVLEVGMTLKVLEKGSHFHIG